MDEGIFLKMSGKLFQTERLEDHQCSWVLLSRRLELLKHIHANDGGHRLTTDLMSKASKIKAKEVLQYIVFTD